MAKQADLKAAKERKQKKIAAVGGVLLVIVLFVQVPRMLKMLNEGSEETATPVLTPSAATTPSPTVPAVAPAPAPEEVLASATLVSFSRFASKDPFVQQVVEEKESGQGEAEAGGSEAPDEGSEAPDEVAPPAEGAIGGTAPDGDTAASPARTSAEIDVNGVVENVSVGSAFPSAAPMFVLDSVGAKSATIKVADGGSFASGEPTLKLVVGKPVTLVNTADGTRFVIRLKAP